MNLQQYIEARPQKKIKADIYERWNSRIEPRGLQTQGTAGAQLYLRDYGKSIAAPKCLQFGALALQAGFTEFGHEFYRKAAQLEGVTLEVSDVGNPNIDLVAALAVRASAVRQATQVFEHTYVPAFPQNMQPGKFSPMQPVDGQCSQAYYIYDGKHWGQPKIDGNKLIVFVTREQVWYQSRTLKLSSAPSLELDQELREAAKYLGNFILEGELTFLDFADKEHRTGSQAATANIELGEPTYLPEMIYSVFSCIYRDNQTLRTYGDMVDEGLSVASFIRETIGSHTVSPIVTAKNAKEKAELAATQKEQGREGEVWFDPDMPYLAGKHKDERFVRTKYLTEFEAVVTGFTETTAEGHAFGAMQITDFDGNDRGSVGTGFTREDKHELISRFGFGHLVVKILCQGYTEAGMAWHARFVEIVE